MARIALAVVALVLVGWGLGVGAYQLATVGAMSDQVAAILVAAGTALAYLAWRRPR